MNDEDIKKAEYRISPIVSSVTATRLINELLSYELRRFSLTLRRSSYMMREESTKGVNRP